MTVAFYYHIPIKPINNSCLSVPSYLGVFIDSLANNVDQLILVMHQANEDYEEADYSLKASNISWVNLGIKTPAWHRVIFHEKILKEKLDSLINCDVFLVRSPSPLSPYFGRYLKKSIKLVYMIVGDYSSSLEDMKLKTLRQIAIKYLLKYNNYLFEKQIKKTDVLVNSSVLYKKYLSFTKSIHEIRTTTLSEGDFYQREDTCQSDTINILYTGRIDRQKGLFELVEATALLIKEGNNIMLHLVGWEYEKTEPIKNALQTLAKEKNIQEKIIFHGRKKVGQELNTMYRIGDIYVLPSYHEGFPRTIWEAMANSLPVVATKVGSIPYFLKNNVNAVLIETKNVNDILSAVKKMIHEPIFRQHLIKQGLLLAKENTLEYQTKKIVNILKYVAIN
jgi:glycosyltransferase involved in cell wall biosynthesis